MSARPGTTQTSSLPCLPTPATPPPCSLHVALLRSLQGETWRLPCCERAEASAAGKCDNVSCRRFMLPPATADPRALQAARAWSCAGAGLGIPFIRRVAFGGDDALGLQRHALDRALERERIEISALRMATPWQPDCAADSVLLLHVLGRILHLLVRERHRLAVRRRHGALELPESGAECGVVRCEGRECEARINNASGNAWLFPPRQTSFGIGAVAVNSPACDLLACGCRERSYFLLKSLEFGFLELFEIHGHCPHARDQFVELIWGRRVALLRVLDQNTMRKVMIVVA